ncbi:DC-STAMP domain-containing protein 2-like [Anabrus simplex]|uniref:DC-STAMP domain-containing protein 2-like n=1 Tax=Anabrus simplex TaxID=316456 RepID=UPI0035A3653C
MSYFIRAWKISRFGTKFQRYKEEKENALKVQEGKTPLLSLAHKLYKLQKRIRKKIRYFFSRIFFYHPDSCLSKLCKKLTTDGTIENYVAKSFVGFFVGVVLTYTLFTFLIFKLNFGDASATKVCAVAGAIFTLGLAFSLRARLIMFLILPQFFSKRGRQALMAYAFILAITGPGKNMLHNTEVLSESLACGQEQLKNAVRQTIDAMKKPFLAVKESLKEIVAQLEKVVGKLKDALLSIKRIVLNLVKIIKTAASWLASIFLICSKKLGTPFERCSRVFENSVADCRAALGPLFNWLCSIVYVTSFVCYVLKIFDLICMLIDFIKTTIVGVVTRKLKEFMSHLHNIFYVSLEFHHEFHFSTNQSKSFEQISAGIVTEIKQRTNVYLGMFDWISLSSSFFFLVMFLKAYRFWGQYLTQDRFENIYITKYFYELDIRRARLQRETVLPLNKREKRKYIPLASWTLVKTERMKLTKNAMFLGSATLKLGIHILGDFCLYWILNIIRIHGSVQSKVKAPNMVGVHVQGEGVLSDIFRVIVKAFQPLGIELEIDTVPCLPKPRPPDFNRYIHITTVVALCWLLAIGEPYGLRLRHTFMALYHPDRARQRAIWLYNNIIRSRYSFLTFARRQLRRKFTKRGIDKVTIVERIRARFPWLVVICGPLSQETCVVCATVIRASDTENIIRCKKLGCLGRYCVECYADMKNMCTICMEPMEYGDLSDVSVEFDSSSVPDEEESGRDRESETGMPRPRRTLSSTALIHQSRSGGSDRESDSDARSSSTQLSYTYQYRVQVDAPGPYVAAARWQRPPFKDLEAQKQLDLATLPQFNEPSDFDETDFEEEEEEEEDESKKLKPRPSLIDYLLNYISRATWMTKPYKGKVKSNAEDNPLLSTDGNSSDSGSTECEENDLLRNATISKLDYKQIGNIDQGHEEIPDKDACYSKTKTGKLTDNLDEINLYDTGVQESSPPLNEENVYSIGTQGYLPETNARRFGKYFYESKASYHVESETPSYQDIAQENSLCSYCMRTNRRVSRSEIRERIQDWRIQKDEGLLRRKKLSESYKNNDSDTTASNYTYLTLRTPPDGISSSSSSTLSEDISTDMSVLHSKTKLIFKVSFHWFTWEDYIINTVYGVVFYFICKIPA